MFDYNVLFQFAFPNWKGPIPQINEENKFLSSSSDEEINKKEKYILWEIFSNDKLNNLNNEKKLIKEINSKKLIKFNLIFENNKIKTYNNLNNLPIFSNETIHIIPNILWIFTIDSNFLNNKIIIDPLIIEWLQNTEIFINSNIILSIEKYKNNYFENFKKIYKEIKNKELYNWYINIELPHLRLLGKMHQKSFKFNINLSEIYLKDINIKLINLEKEIFEISNEKFNILSPYECSEILFNKLKLKQNNNNYNNFKIDSRHRITNHRIIAPTSSKYLKLINHPICKLIIDFRSLSKIKSNWLNFKDYCDENQNLHPYFQICSTATGRISSINPNLQNIPIKNEYYNIRSLFLPSNNNILISVDYSQLELRILAFYSNDNNLIKLCNKKNIDIHQEIGKYIYNVNNISNNQRDDIKKAIYSTIYGKTKDINSKKILELFPEINKFINNTISNSLDGKISTISGKIRYLPNINNSNKTIKKRDERIAINTLIQGTAADFVKFALLEIVKKIENKAFPILQIHDEWIFETEINQNSIEFKNLIKDIKLSSECSRKFGLNIDIPVVISIGNNYSNLVNFDDDNIN